MIRGSLCTVHETGELERLLSCTTISLDCRETSLLSLSLISLLASDSICEPVLILSLQTTFPVRSYRNYHMDRSSSRANFVVSVSRWHSHNNDGVSNRVSRSVSRRPRSGIIPFTFLKLSSFRGKKLQSPHDCQKKIAVKDLLVFTLNSGRRRRRQRTLAILLSLGLAAILQPLHQELRLILLIQPVVASVVRPSATRTEGSIPT